MPKTVLLADDSVTAQNMGRRILTDAGYEVITVNNGSAALKKIHESRPDLIVLDVYMPGYGGLEVCQRLKESGDTMRIPVLLTVGKMEPFKPDEAKRVRADAHIIKPFEASELLAALTRLEDRIVPEAETPKSGRSKKEKKSRFWNIDSTVADQEEDKSGEISRFAELKRREQERPKEESQPEVRAQETASAKPPEAQKTEEVAAPKTVVEEAPVAQASAVAEEKAEQEEAPATFASANVADEVKPAEPTAEFAVSTPQYEEATPEAAAAAVEQSVSAEVEPVAIDVPAAEKPSEISASAPPEVSSKTRWVAENVALSAEEASLALEHEMQQAQGAAAAPAKDVVSELAAFAAEVPAESPTEASPVAEAAVAEPPVAEPVSEVPIAEAKESGAAFAAAASASSAKDAVATASVPKAAEYASDPEPPVASEAAAAWENWQQIRDRVMSSQATDAIAKSVADVAQASAASASEPAQAREGSASSELEGEALASIVDTVLAELKPKLMQEIAKKLKK